uniref:EGF-like domain-containing protein n=1 Tax=Globisporangium ultimum (strain ATCC 200006 / CBS 805.95 / DAOM BR144) TaxID=431595 RepID=K3XA33_GLOUD
MMDPNTRTSARTQQYDFAASFNFHGDLLDFTMDGGVTLTPRRQRIEENGVRGEYSVVLNRRPLNDVKVRAEVVQLVNANETNVQQLRLPNDTFYEVVFTRSNWNQEQIIRVIAVDDAIAEGVHYSVITHSSLSLDPNFNGSQTPFLYGRNITMQVEDNDFASIKLSRVHMYIGEGGLTDTYEVVLNSRPWYPVFVTVLALHPNQTHANESFLTFMPESWNIPQTVIVSAIDDHYSEVEFGGLHYGGKLLHYSESNDFRYHSRRPQCFDIPNCDLTNESDCLLPDVQAQELPVRVCDITSGCNFTLGNGACIARVFSDVETIPARFGRPALNPSLRDARIEEASMTYTVLQDVLQDQEIDGNIFAVLNSTDLTFVPPPVELRGFVLSFLGLLNLDQVQKLGKSPKRTLHTVCAGIGRLETHRWAFEEWPSGYVDRVLHTVLQMFPEVIDERRLWNCGASVFRPGNSIDVSIWDNDPGVTLSTTSLTVRESAEGSTNGSTATYSIVLNAAPSTDGGSLRVVNGICREANSDTCGFWADDFSTIAPVIYNEESSTNISIAIIANSQITVSPSVVTFTARNWFIPQWITVRAVDDDMTEVDATYTITHRVQNSPLGYTNMTAFWFKDTFQPASSLLFPRGTTGGDTIPYNMIPTILHSPSHQCINVAVEDNDKAGVQIVVDQPKNVVTTKESADKINWIGDYATSFAFSDISVATRNSDDGGHELQNFLVLGSNYTSYVKFHLPYTHEGDSNMAFSFSTLRLFQTPFKIFNVSDAANDSASSSNDAGLFMKYYRLRISLVQNSWTPESVGAAEDTASLPSELEFVATKSIEVTAVVEKSQSAEVDVTPLVAQLLPTRSAVVSLKIEVIDGLEGMTQFETQICSSVFERKLRPTLRLGYTFPNLLLHNSPTQSSTANSLDGTSPFSAVVATNGDRNMSKATSTESEMEPWWETCFAETKKVGSIALFLPETMYTGNTVSDTVHIVVIATLKELKGQAMSLNEALESGCPEACPISRRISVRTGIIIRDIQAGTRCLRIYREGSGPLELVEVEAYDAFLSITPTADESGLRSRVKTDWTAQKASESWRVQQSAKHSEDENIAIGMMTRQSSTSPENALSYLAVDGQRAKAWDAIVVQGDHVGLIGENNLAMEPGSTRTKLEMDPWWEVDLGSVKPISSIVLYPFIGENGRNFCRSNPADQFPAWSGDLYSYSKTDQLLMLEEPFLQNFEVLITDTSIAMASDPTTVTVSKKTTLVFSCENGTTSIGWADVFTKGRFVTVRKHGLGVLMLNEVEVYQWNPGSTTRYLLLDFYGVGGKPMALSSIQLFPPTDVTASAGGYALPIPFNIHSVSSQLAATGSGSALALTGVANSDCYIAAKTSFHEWVVLDLIKPTKIGLIEFDSNVDKCGSSVAPIHSISIAGYGSALDGIRSDNASSKLAAYSADTCQIDSMGIVKSSAALSSCKQFVCGEEFCNSQRTAIGSTSTLVLSDFCDLIHFGVVELFPLARLPLSQNEHRALLLRDNPVALWAFDDQPKLPIASAVVGAAKGRATGVLAFSSVETSKQFLIGDSKEDTFFSNAVLAQAAMPSFSLEFWLRFTQAPKVSADNASINIVTLDSGSIVFASVGISSMSSTMIFELTDSTSGKSCRAAMDRGLPSPSTAIYYHVVASYDPSSAIISLTIRYSHTHEATMTLMSAQSTCSLAMLSISKKTLNFGAYKASTGVNKAGFVGVISNVAWYVRVLGRSEMLDHYHDFLWGVADVKTPSHNSYSLRLTSKPWNPVLIDVNAESLCYRFNMCNVTVTPSALVILPENWMELRTIHAVATDDQLFEGAHITQLTHETFSEPAYQLVSSATTFDLFASGIEDSTIDLMTGYERLVSEFYKELRVLRVLEDPEVLHLREDRFAELRAMWSFQQMDSNVLVNEPYNENLTIDPLSIDLIDLTIPGIEFSTSSLVVSEDGKGNDYQVMILSEPKGIVEISISVDAECYRKCIEAPLCPSQARREEGGDLLVCGDESTPTKLCNITISPDTLYFSGSNWKFPQTVRVVAVDDQLDEADMHLTSIKSTSKSVDPVYDNLFLPNVVVAVADNDETDLLYSTKYVTLSEKDSGSTRLVHNYSTGNMYTLRLATEPWANVTIAMSNEANHSCYRPCGYHFDNVSCGLPRQESVSSVRLSTNSTREIHQISLSIPKVTEVQRIVTYSEHVDHIYRLELTGGFTEEVQVVIFQFDDAFKLRFKSADAIKNAVTYGRTFRISASGRSTFTVALDGFSSAASVEAALQTLFKQTQQAFQVTRNVSYDQSSLNWAITFTRLLRENGTFPLLSVTLDTAFDGTLSVNRSSVCVPPSGSFLLRYGATESAATIVPALVKADGLEGALRDLDAVFAVAVTRSMHKSAYGFEYTITFGNVDAYYSLQVDASTLVAAPKSGTAILLNLTQMQAPIAINGMFQVQYISSFNSTNNVTTTRPLPWNATEGLLKKEISRINGLGNVSVSRRQLSAEGGMEWTVEFTGNNGQMDPLTVRSLNLTGNEVTIVADTIRDGESLGGTFIVEMGGLFKKRNPGTERVYWMDMAHKNTTGLPFNISAVAMQQALFNLNITELTYISREDLDCDAFTVCNGYTWTISYQNSPGNVPPIRVYKSNSFSGTGAVLTSATIANGTYIGGKFSLTLDLFDIDKEVWCTGTTWNLPVNVSAIGMDQALEAIPFVRSNREAEFNPETGLWRGIKFDKGVRVFREGPYLDGGHTWRLEWAIEDYIRFQDLKITINASLVTQEILPLEVATEYDLDGIPRCAAIPTARFEPDQSDPFGLRGWCVYDITNVTIQERFLCNYTVENPWIVFTPENWCIPQQVRLTSVDDFIDEQTVDNENVTFSNVSHTVFSDDLLYSKLDLDPVLVEVESDDFSEVLVSETYLEVSEDGSMVAQYMLQLKTEPLYDVKIVVLPWLDGKITGCYRFGLCNLTIPANEYIFTPRDWDVAQTVVVLATDDDLDEYDSHMTGISHISYSNDIKYHEIAIPKINVTVFDNDVSTFEVSKTSVTVTEGGAYDEYKIVLGSEPFTKVTVDIANVGAVGNLAIASPTRLLFTWKDWNISQTVRVDAFDDFTEDPKDSSSVMVHTIRSNDVNYANLEDLGRVNVFITDNDVSGISLSTNGLNVSESNTTVYTYGVRLNSEPWQPVVLSPNAKHGCYVRVVTSETLCNATILSPKLYFGAGNWSKWQNVSFLAFDDWLTESPVHRALITHLTASKDPLYQVANYSQSNGKVRLWITDNDFSYVNISLQAAGERSRMQLHVAEGGFNDSYRIVLNAEPYEDVQLILKPALEEFVNLDTKAVVRAPQVGAVYGTSSSMSASPTSVRAIEIMFTALDWFQPRVIQVFAIDDNIAEDPTQYSSILHEVVSADANYNISNSSVGATAVTVMVNDKESIPPPIPILAIFDASGSKLQVTFDSSVYHVDTMNVRDAQPSDSIDGSSLYLIKRKQFPCSLVFNFAAAKYSLGTGAVCLWLDLTNLLIELGSGATIAAKDVLSLNDCSTFANQYCQSTNVIRARHTSRAYTQASVAVQVPSDIVKPKVIFIAPDDASSCGLWSVDASLSQGAGGRAFTQTYWFALPKLFFLASSLGDTDFSRARAILMYSSLDALCLKYAADWKSGSSSSIYVPSSDLTTNPDLAFVSTMEQLRSACYMRSVAQSATIFKSLKIQINSTLIEPGVEYVVGLELVNAFAQRTTTTKIIQVRSLPGPTVFVIGDANLEIARFGDPIVLQVDSAISCTEVIGTQAGYKWSVVSAAFNGSVYTPVDFSSKNTAKDPRVFRIPRTALDAETSYRFQIESYMKNTTKTSSNSSTVILINVVASALIASIAGGNRALGERDALVLNANASTDPDLSVVPFTYTWSCTDITNASLPQPQPCVNASASTSVKTNELDLSESTGALLSIAPFSIEMNRKLSFSLSVAKEASGLGKASRNTSISTIIWTLPGNLPDVEISTSIAKINPSNRVILSAQVKSTYPYTSQWVQLQGDLDLPGGWEVNGTTHNDAFALPLTSLNNVILKDKLTGGMTYIFRLIVTDINGNQGFGSTSVTVNSPPSSGRFEVAPKSGYAIEDEFSLYCAEWTDDAEDMPLKYSFGVMSTFSFDALVATTNDITQLGALLRTKSVPLVSAQLIPMVSVTMLPPAGLKDSETITVIAFISDNLGSFAYATESIEVLLPPAVKSDPLGFVSNIMSNVSVTEVATASQKGGFLLSAASVLESAFKVGSRDTPSCAQTDSGTIVCSGRGACESTTLTCVCQDGYVGLECEFETNAVQSINSELLANLESASLVVEPTVSALSHQAMIMDTVLQASPSVFDEDGLNQVTSLSSSIVDNAFSLQDSSAFIDTAGSIVMTSLSTVVSIASDGKPSTNNDNDASVSRSRRLALSTAIDCSQDHSESAQTNATYNQLISTLHSLTAVASQDALSEEDAISISSDQIQAFAAAGTTLKAPNSALSVSLTDPAIACLEPSLFLSALVLSTSTHSRCKLGNLRQISANTAVMVHSKAAVEAAASGSSSALQTQTLSSMSLCVAQVAAKSATTANAQRRLTSNDASSGETILWHPLIVLSIPHNRALSAIELRNFTTTCQVWNVQRSAWDADVCLYDEATSTLDTTICYCNEIGRLEVVVTLEERLDFQALYKDLYRNEPASIVPSVAAAILFSLFIVGTKIGQRMDSSDEKKYKEKTIKNLNRAKWGELHERTQSNAVLEDFSAFYQRKKMELQASADAEQSPVTETIDHLTLTDADQGARIAEVMTPMTQIDPYLVLPNEVATLFEATKKLETQYLRVLGVFRFCNALLVVLGVILAFVGVDFYLVLGNSTSELLLYVYGNVLGLVIAVFGGAIVIAGLFGLIVSRKRTSHLSRHTYMSLVLLLLIAQAVFTAIAYRYLDDFKTMPSALRSGLSRVWNSLADGTKEEIEIYYGCCGFVSVKESSACPEEALDALPPRTCSHVLAIEAQEFFAHSFVYIEVLLLVQVLCITIANMLVKWRHLRLLELAGEPASSATGETSAKRSMLHSQVNVVLLCTLPSLYYVLACALVFAILCGLDMVLQANYISNALTAALYGMEVGVALIVAAGIYLLILARGIHAVAYRDIRGLQRFVVLFLGFLIISVGISQFLTGIQRNLLLDPVIMQTTEARFLALPRQTLANLEVAMECCGFDATSEGTCLLSDSDTGTNELTIRTCRATVEQILGSNIAVLTTRVTAFVLVEAVVFVLSAILLVRLRRFATKAPINPIDKQPVADAEVDGYQTSWDVFVHNACFFVVMLLNFVAGVLGMVLAWVGIDVVYQLNVLHLAYLLQSVFDKQLGVYLVVLGSGFVVFAVAGFGLAWKRSRRLFFIYGVAGLALFVAIFGALGLSFRFSHHATSYTSSDATAFHLEEAWKVAPATAKMYIQNAFTCCGYAKVKASNGTVTYTDMAEVPYWMQVHEATSVDTYSQTRRLSESSRETQAVTTRRELTETRPQVKTQPLCPEAADTGCSVVMTTYLVHVADYAFKLCVAMLVFLVTVLGCVSVLFVRQGRKTPWRQTWKMVFSRIGLLVFAFGSMVASLTTLFISLDLISRWSIFSSSLLQLLFAFSIGIALLVYAMCGLGVNLYSLYAASQNAVHPLFFQSIGRAVFALSMWVAVALTAYLSKFSANVDWQSQLNSFLDHKWNTLSPYTQHVISLDYACCGFHDPVIVKGKGIGFDRPAMGYTCPLSSPRGCDHVLVEQISSSFAWLFEYFVGLAATETVLLALGVVLLKQLKQFKQEEWFAIESRVRYVASKYKSEARKHHLAFSLGHLYDAKFTRSQRIVSILCAMLTTLAIYTGYFTTQGCHRKSLKTCEQPNVWAMLGMGLMYGGLAGYAAQCACRFLFELVRHRCDLETSEVASARQRKEKVLLFRSLFFQRRRPPQLSSLANLSPAVANAVPSGSGPPSSTMDTLHATTEERWYTWLTKFVYRVYHIVAISLFLLACGIGTFMGLVLIGFHDSLYGVEIDQGPKELLIVSLFVALTSLAAWLAIDMKNQKRSGSHVVFIITAIASLLLMACILVGVYMVHQVLEESTDAISNWTIRKTGFSVVQHLERAWKSDTSAFFRNRVQQELQCCGFRSASDTAFRPCPTGTFVQVEYEALSVNGSAIMKTQEELVDVDGCLGKMLGAFHDLADTISYFAIGVCLAQFVLLASSVFLAYDIAISKDAKLKLRVNEGSKERKSDVRLTFEKVVGLKIAAPARGKILSQMLSSSLNSVTPTIATELSNASLIAPPQERRESASAVISSASKMASSHAPPETVLPSQRRKSLTSLSRLQTSLGHQEEIASVPYPASIVYVIFAICGAWIAVMTYLIINSSMDLGKATAWQCILCWCVGMGFHFVIIEPAVIFVRILWSTLGAWWQTTWVVRLARYGREALRIQPDAATAAARHYASLSLYERIRFNAAVRIQRRLATRITRRRYLQVIRDRLQDTHRTLAEQRRATVKHAIECFTEEEITAFHLLFQDADAAKMGLVSYTVISQSIYQLGVRVAPELVFQFLNDLDPAYADLVDFEHFLYGMHCVRKYHQEEQNAVAGAAESLAAEKAIDREKAKALLKEEFVSSSTRFGPRADPQSKILVKRQNLLRELKEKRDSLSYKLMSKVGKLPPLLSRGSSKSLIPKSAPATSDNGVEDKTLAEQKNRFVRDGGSGMDGVEEASPTGTYVILQNRKLSPKKRALEMGLKKKSREEKGKARDDAAGDGIVTKSPSKKAPSSTQRAKTMFQNWKALSPRKPSPTESTLLLDSRIAIVEEEEEVEETTNNFKATESVAEKSQVAPLEDARPKSSTYQATTQEHERTEALQLSVGDNALQAAVPLVIDSSTSLSADHAPAEETKEPMSNREATTGVSAARSGDLPSPPPLHRTAGIGQNEARSEEVKGLVVAALDVEVKTGEPAAQFVRTEIIEHDSLAETKLAVDQSAVDEAKTHEDGHKVADDYEGEDEDNESETDGTAMQKEDEPKPFGTYMLLNKQAPSAGKSKILDSILQKKSKPKSPRSGPIEEAEVAQPKDEVAAGSPTAAMPPSSQSSVADAGEEVMSHARPRTSEKKASIAKNTSLEQALKKNLAKGGKGRGGGSSGTNKQSRLRTPSTPPSSSKQ